MIVVGVGLEWGSALIRRSNLDPPLDRRNMRSC